MQAIGKKTIPVGKLAVILGALATLGPFATDMYLSGFQGIADYFNTDVSKVQLTLSVYFLGLAVGQMIYGPIVDHFGRRKPLLFGIALFVISSFLITVAPNIQSLIMLRLLQALGGCAGMIVGRAIVRDLFDLRDSARFMSMLAVVQGLGPIVAPILGSYLLTVSNWQSVFLFVGAFGLCCLIASALGLPESMKPEEKSDAGFAQVLKDYWGLLRHMPFLVPALSGSLASSCMFSYICGSPFVFMHIYGVSAKTYGLIFGCNAVGILVAAQINRLLLRKFMPQGVMSYSVVVNVAFTLGLLAATYFHATMLVYMIPLWLCIAMMPLVFANSIAVAMHSCQGKAGSASALIGLMQFGLASMASAFVSILHNDTAYPMVISMLAGVLGSALVLAIGKKHIKNVS